MSIFPVGEQSVFSRKYRYIRQWLYLLTGHPDPGLPKIKPNRRPSTGYRSRSLVHSESNLTFALRHICTSNLSFPQLYWCFEVYGRILSHAWRVIRRVVWGPGPLLSLSQALSVGPTAACESEPRRLVRNGWGWLTWLGWRIPKHWTPELSTKAWLPRGRETSASSTYRRLGAESTLSLVRSCVGAQGPVRWRSHATDRSATNVFSRRSVRCEEGGVPGNSALECCDRIHLPAAFEGAAIGILSMNDLRGG